MRVSEEPVCIQLLRQNPVFTSLHLKTPVHVVPPQSICSLAGQEVKGEGRISCDTIIQISRQNSLAFIMESVHLINADNNVGFYEFFILWYIWKSIGEIQNCKGNLPRRSEGGGGGGHKA